MWHLEATHPGGILGLMSSVSSGKSNRNMIVAIAALVAVWLTVMFYRNEIRARWRVHKLTDLAATHPDPQMRRQAVRGLGAEGKVTVLRQIVRTYLSLPVKPRAGQMLFICDNVPPTIED